MARALGVPLASLLQGVLVQALGLLALQQGVCLERRKRVASGASATGAFLATVLQPTKEAARARRSRERCIRLG